MTDRQGESELDADQRELADRLAADRPVPAAQFRGVLGRHLAGRDPGYGPRPAGLRRMVALYLAAGGALLVVGALQAGGVL
jgi:hypothetical protein